MEKLYTIAEAAKQIGIAPVTLTGKIREGKFPAIHIGYQWRIRESDLRKEIAKRKASS